MASCMEKNIENLITWELDVSLGKKYLVVFPLPPSANEFGLFEPDEDPTKGRWLEQGQTLEYYSLKSGVSVLLVKFSQI